MKVTMVVGVVLAVVAVIALLLLPQFQNEQTEIQVISNATSTGEVSLDDTSTTTGEFDDLLPTSSPTTPITTPKPTDDPTTPISNCFVGGCSSQICSDRPDMMSTCEWREEYACYRTATCELQTSGQCGWTETAELKACLAAGGEVI